FSRVRPPPAPTLFPYTTLFRSELILDRIPEPKAKATRAKPALEISPFQPVIRDFAFIVDRAVKAADLVRAAQNADKQLITDVTRSEEHTSELQSRENLVCRLLL